MGRQAKIESLARKLAKAQSLMARGKVTGYGRHDKVQAEIENLTFGEQTAVQMIAMRIRDER